MNPFLFIKSSLKSHITINLSFIFLVAISVGLGIGISSQERALRKGTAKAADKFDLLITSPGSKIDMLLNIVYLRHSFIELIPPENWTPVLSEKKINFAAPIVFGDSYKKIPIVGSIPKFVSHLSNNIIEGRLFNHSHEVVVGAGVFLKIGDIFTPSHGLSFVQDNEGHEGQYFKVVGILPYTGTPWDKAIITSVESIWNIHGLPNGHNPKGPTPKQIGPPFDNDFLPGVSVVIVNPKNISAAYGIRNKYQTNDTMAFFPAEVLVQLYRYFANVTKVLKTISISTQILIILSVIIGLIILMQLFSKQFAIFRAIGATKNYIFYVIWINSFVLVLIGCILGLIFGYLFTFITSMYIVNETGIYFKSSIGYSELYFIIYTLIIGLAISTIPAINLYRYPVIKFLR